LAVTPRDESGWTIETYSAHNEALRAAAKELAEERDRRYSEVDIEKEKALKIKETADLAALSLARDIQIYKDEKANELRSQIERERGTYTTQTELRGAVEKIEARLDPLVSYMSALQGRREGIGASTAVLYSALILALAIITAVLLYTGRGHAAPPPSTVTVTVPTK
jgi:hypothetical protein